MLTSSTLWIDFKLYFYVRIHKYKEIKYEEGNVVNWFQIVFLRENSQGTHHIFYSTSCCELISNCIFTWEFTRQTIGIVYPSSLWIDFKLYFYVRIHKNNQENVVPTPVVNWFQIVFLRENSQVIFNNLPQLPCCELISNCIFTWEFTRWIF